jgi:hypothetical protein
MPVKKLPPFIKLFMPPLSEWAPVWNKNLLAPVMVLAAVPMPALALSINAPIILDINNYWRPR